MSKTIDEKVVSMQFDNRNFEKNVSTTMSTLDKLKQKLNFTGASKGLDEVNSAAKRVDMNGLAKGVETVHARFSALEVMGVTALANITNSAVNAGKRMVSALTIDPIKTGFQEYETQMNAVQTILANTQSKGSTLDDVNNALDLLNTYADKTIYNFTEMTRNIGTFTAAGVDLQTSVDSIKGIANLAAVSGSSSQQASSAMYQLSQALAAGKVSLMDWNSVVNAGMGGELFQNALKRTAENMGTNVDALIKKYGSFRESLTQGEWLTTEVLTETLKQLSGAYSEADLIAQGFTKEQAKEITKLADTAVSAATEVKTFTQLWDVMKEAAQSGWSQTWKLLVGDFEEAKSLLTPLADFFTGDNGIITKMSNARNKLLEGALGKTFTGLVDKIKGVTEPIKKSADGVKAVVDSVKDYGKVVDEILGGKWGSGQERWDKLAKSGYDWAHAQNLVNEKLGDGTKHATKYKEAQKETAKSQKETTESTVEYISELVELSDAQLKAKGYTDEQIKAFRELEKAADKTGIPLKEFIENIDEIDGRYLLINSFKNVGKGLVTVFQSIGKAWRDAFPAMQSDQLYNIIAGIHKFTTYLVVSKDTANDLTRTLKGVFAILDIIASIAGGAFRIAFRVIKETISVLAKTLGYVDILSFTAAIGDAISAFRDWIEEFDIITLAIKVVVPLIVDAAKAVGDMAKAFMELPQVQKVFDNVRKGLEKLKEIDLREIGKNIVEGLQNGLKGGADQAVKAIIELGTKILESIKEVLGIHSPSTEFFEIGQNIVQGLINGISSGISWVIEGLKKLGNTIIEFFKGLDWNFEFFEGFKEAFTKFKDYLSQFDYGKLLAIIPVTAVLLIVKKIYDITSALADGINSFNNVIEGFADVTQSFSKVLNGFALNLKADALKKMAISIAILVGAVVALTLVDQDKLGSAVVTIVILAGVLAALAWASSKMSEASVKIGKDGFNIDGLKSGLISIGAALLLLAGVVKIVGSMKPEEAKQGFLGLAAMMVAMGIFMAAAGFIGSKGSFEHVSKIGGMMIKLSIAMGLMVGVCKLINTLKPEEMIKGVLFATAFGIFVMAITSVAKSSGNNVSKAGSMILKISLAMGLMVGVCKLVGLLSYDDMIKGGLFAIAFGVFVYALVNITKIGKRQQIAKLGGLLMGVSTSMLLMVGICKLVSLLSVEDMVKGGLFVGAFLLLVKALVKVTTIGNDQKIAKVAGTILAMSIAVGLLAGVAILLSMVPLDGLAKGVVAVSMLGLVLAAMIKATQGAAKVVGNLVVMTVAIALMAGAAAALSYIDPARLAGATVALSLLMGMFALIAKQAGMMGKSLGSLIIMTVAVGLLGGMLYILAKLPIENVLPIAASLSILLLSLSGACAILTAVGSFAPAAFAGIGALLTLIGSVGALIIGIGALADKFPKLEEFLNTGIPILEKIGHALGSFFGNIIGGFAEGVTSGLPGIGTNLSSFMTNLKPFIDGAKSIDETALNGVSSLVKMVALVAGANIIEKIGSFITGGSSMDTFASQLGLFGDAIIEFSNKVKGNIDEESVVAAATAGKLLAEMQSMVAGTGGVVQWFSGEKNLGTFGAQLKAFGTAIAEFSKTVSAEGAINPEAVTAAATAGKVMAELQSSIAPTGGVLQWLAGEKNLGEFGTQLEAYGTAVAKFSKAVSAEGAINPEAVTAAATAGEIMAKLQSSIEPSKGVWQWLAGEKNLGTFGSQLKSYGTAIAGFSKSISGENAINPEAITAAANAGKVMGEVQKAIPEDKWLDGKISIDDFGKKIKSFGESIKSYSEKVSGIDASAVSSSTKAAKSLVSIAKSVSGIDPDEIGNFSKVKNIGEAVKKYSDKVADADFGAISSSISSVKKLTSLINSMGNIDGGNISNFKSAINSLAKTNFNGFVKAFSESSNKIASTGANLINSLVKGIKSKQSSLVNSVNTMVSAMLKNITSKHTSFNSAGSKLANQFVSGIKKSSSKAKTAMTSVVKSCLSGISGYYNNFYSAGKSLVNGFAAGISANSFKAAAKATAMANAAEKAAKKALDINSPSKVFRAIGTSVPEGFAQGIGKLGNLVSRSTNNMADRAIEGTKSAMSRIAEAVNADVDTQPTIRPVLDLSGVASGAGAINGMFGMTPSVGVLSNVRSINSMMNNRNQNGVNDDVVSAIKDLEKTIGNASGDSYNINGVTYDDGSNITDAVKAIVRAAKVERRT